jgi:hypothetical protein
MEPQERNLLSPMGSSKLMALGVISILTLANRLPSPAISGNVRAIFGVATDAS